MMATHYTALINPGNGRRLSDGIDQPTAPASDLCPYLRQPNPVPPDELPPIDFARA